MTSFYFQQNLKLALMGCTSWSGYVNVHETWLNCAAAAVKLQLAAVDDLLLCGVYALLLRQVPACVVTDGNCCSRTFRQVLLTRTQSSAADY